jgi:hypothetical protein
MMVEISTNISNIHLWQMAIYLHVVGKHLHDHIILLKRKVLAHLISLTLPLFIGVSIPR